VSVEEFIEASEFTYDTICAGGEVLFDNIGWYRPRPLIARQLEWISPVTMVVRDIDAPELSSGRAMGRDVLRALGFRDGFTHMEWYRRDSGEVVFGEIGARPPGARTVDVMNYANDIDLFQQWAEALVQGRLSERGWSYGEVARRGGLPRSTVYTLATTRNLVRPPRPATIDGLAKGLEVPVSAVRAAAAESTGMHYYEEPAEGSGRGAGGDQERQLLIASIDELSAEDRRHVAALVESLRNRSAPPADQ